MFNIFQWCILGRRVTSYTTAVSCFLVGIYLLRRHPIHISTMLSMSFCSFGHAVYETVFMYSTTAWRGVGLFSALRCIGTAAIIKILNDRYNYIKFDRMFIVLSLGWLITNVMMYVTGFYVDVSTWTHELFLDPCSSFPDPHNWLSALNMALGFYMWLPLIRRTRARTRGVQRV